MKQLHELQEPKSDQQTFFSPDDKRAMAFAFDKACNALGVNQADPMVAQLIADKIVGIAETGVRDPDQLSEMAARELDGLRRRAEQAPPVEGAVDAAAPE
jgi:hypothetical protein